MMFQKEIQIHTGGSGLYEFTDKVKNIFDFDLPEVGLVNLFVRHTSASLLIQENADPTAKADLESFIDLLAPENQSWHTHVFEGPDDTTSHLKAAVTNTFLQIPIVNGSLGLGTWQGIYLWEHRRQKHTRKVLCTLQGE